MLATERGLFLHRFNPRGRFVYGIYHSEKKPGCVCCCCLATAYVNSEGTSDQCGLYFELVGLRQAIERMPVQGTAEDRERTDGEDRVHATARGQVDTDSGTAES